jgi:hypothetical protein
MISDRRGPCALNAARAHAVTYPAEGHLKDYAPFTGVALLRRRYESILKTKNLGDEKLGET